MSIFSANPQAALDKTLNKIAAIEQNISELRVARQAKLVVAEDAAEVMQTDRAIQAEEVNLQIYRDKVRALKEEVRKGEYAQREKDRRAAIEKIKAKLKRREETAADLQAAIERVGELFSDLVGRDEAEQHWPFPRPGHGFAVLDLRGVNKEISWALHGLVHGRHLPEPSSAGLGVTGISALGVAEHVRRQNENILSRLETAPIGDDLLEENA